MWLVSYYHVRDFSLAVFVFFHFENLKFTIKGEQMKEVQQLCYI